MSFWKCAFDKYLIYEGFALGITTNFTFRVLFGLHQQLLNYNLCSKSEPQTIQNRALFSFRYRIQTPTQFFVGRQLGTISQSDIE